ncbi:MAG: ABC transporter substrate-binding protein [Dethiobacteria bacterium]|jgi:peptide/nickel transport system substrate-binding protein|nr:hypothetical protein [Bacillota bacterium]HOP69488.1 ABC transporter substrate-binding protein [Bacillota bacterium]HPT34414.1 ABC transporter substrate-binding protein [Bacillota bacterium]HPZ64601.1 ABC transporter substrate-binding protein [Bacillota bacterium]HQD06228.1 ABC transporter substrate-binding protein [Bacillota bacterium]
MSKKSVALLLILLTLAAFVLAGCDQQAAGDDRVIIALWSEPDGIFNPNLSSSTYDYYAYAPVFAGLMRYDPDNEYNLVPELAEKMEMSQDNKSIYFKLRDDIYFHDGTKVTTADVKWTFEWMCHPDYTGPNASMWQFIEGFEAYNSGEADELSGIEIINEREIRFHLTQVDAPTPANIATWGISPRHLFEGTPVGELDQHPAIAKPVGAGPFKFVRYVEGQFIELERYDRYHRGAPRLERIFVKVASPEVALAEILTGSSDIAWVQPNDEELALFEEYGLKVTEFPSGQYQFMGMNLKHQILSDRRVRLAITHALDREAMIETLFDGRGIVPVGHIPAQSWAFNPSLEPLPYDRKKAEALLEEAGWSLGDDGFRYKDGQKLALDLLCVKGPAHRLQNAEIIQQMLKELGIEIQIELVEPAVVGPRIFGERDFDLFLLGWKMNIDPDPSGIWLSTDMLNAVGFDHPENDRLIYAGRSVLDREERKAAYYQWQELLLQEAPYVWLYSENEAWVSNPRIKGFRPDPFDIYWNVWEWYLE